MVSINTELIFDDLTLRNRIVVPPMASQTALESGLASIGTISHYQRLASSGAGMVMVEYSYIDKSGKSEENQLGIDCDSQVPGLAKIAEVIHATKSLAAIQIVHAGGKSEAKLTGSRLITPSNTSVPVRGESLEVGEAADHIKINKLKLGFVKAAGRAVAAGFDIVEIHAAHGYGLNQWLSPLTNLREDEYGGSWKNRGRLLFEIVKEIKSSSPNLALSVRLPGQDHMEGGITQSDSLKTCQELEKLGVSIINISSGIGGWRRPRHITGEGYLVPDARFIQQGINLPVIGVGGIKTKEYINTQLLEKSFSLAAIGRGILENPELGRELGII
jgi:NADPH2 dehydrogenase